MFCEYFCKPLLSAFDQVSLTGTGTINTSTNTLPQHTSVPTQTNQAPNLVPISPQQPTNYYNCLIVDRVNTNSSLAPTPTQQQVVETPFVAPPSSPPQSPTFFSCLVDHISTTSYNTIAQQPRQQSVDRQEAAPSSPGVLRCLIRRISSLPQTTQLVVGPSPTPTPHIGATARKDSQLTATNPKKLSRQKKILPPPSPSQSLADTPSQSPTSYSHQPRRKVAMCSMATSPTHPCPPGIIKKQKKPEEEPEKELEGGGEADMEVAPVGPAQGPRMARKRSSVPQRNWPLYKRIYIAIRGFFSRIFNRINRFISDIIRGIISIPGRILRSFARQWHKIFTRCNDFLINTHNTIHRRFG